MTLTIYGFPPSSYPEGGYIVGPKATIEDSIAMCAKMIIGFAIYGLTCNRPDAYLMGSDKAVNNDAMQKYMIEYALDGCGLERAVRDVEIDWQSSDWDVRTRCAELLWELYENGDFGWYTGVVAPLHDRLPLHAGLFAFVNREELEELWSIGDTVDIALLFETLFDYFSQTRNPWLNFAQELRPYRDSFAAFRLAGAYGIRGRG